MSNIKLNEKRVVRICNSLHDNDETKKLKIETLDLS
jgi:hypothetical protein